MVTQWHRLRLTKRKCPELDQHTDPLLLGSGTRNLANYNGLIRARKFFVLLNS